MAVPLCQISGVLNDPAGNPLADATITFNTYRVQIVNAEVVAPVVISTTTDDQGNLSPIALAQGVTVQITINNFAPVNAIVPFVGQTTISTLLAGAVGSQNLSGAFSIVTFTGSATPSPASGGTAILLYSTSTNSVILSTSGGAYFRVLTEDDFPIAVPQGGTGVVNIPANSILMGNGVGAVLNIAAGDEGTVLIGTGTASAPVFSSNVEVSVLVATGQVTAPLVNTSSIIPGSAGTLTLASNGANSLIFRTNGVNRWVIDSNGHFVPQSAGLNVGSSGSPIGTLFATNINFPAGIIRELPIPIDGATIEAGTPTLTDAGEWALHWLFDPNIEETIALTSLALPEHYIAGSPISVVIHYNMVSATTGNVTLFTKAKFGSTTAAPVNTGNISLTTAVPSLPERGGSTLINLSPPAQTITVGLYVGRGGGNPGDTAAGDLRLLGVKLRYLAVD